MTAASSPGSATPAPVRLCFTALARLRALPSSVRGPVDFWALARLAAIRAGLDFGWAAGIGTAPIAGA